MSAHHQRHPCVLSRHSEWKASKFHAVVTNAKGVSRSEVFSWTAKAGVKHGKKAIGKAATKAAAVRVICDHISG